MLMVALTVPLLVVASTLDNKPTLSFEGARIQVAQDGSVQLLFDVCLSQINMSNGTQFTLSYNPDYLTPSNFADNKALVWGGRGGKYTAPSKDAFRPAAGLYYGDADGDGVPGDEPPFAAMDDKSHIVNWSDSTISMYLLLNNNLSVDTTKNSLISTVKIGDGTRDTMNVFNIPAGEKLVLGTMSFRVTDPDLEQMSEITRRFDGLTDRLFETNHAKDVTGTATDADRLIYFTEKGTQDPGDGVWSIGVCEKRTNDYAHKTINDYDAGGTVSSAAQATFSYRFPPTIIKARAAEAQLTLNAYQAYTDGTVSDIDAALQKYSPAITVTYSDGSEGNFIMPWNRAANATDSNGDPIVKDNAGNLISDLPWTATVVHDQNAAGDTKPVVVDGTAASGEIAYDCTASRYVTETTKANQLYLVEKGFCYEEEDYDHVKRRKTFPIPIAVNLTVTPVTLVDITASDLERTYLLNDDLVDEANAQDRAVQNLSALRLPGQARLVTDVPVGGGTLTMDIPGWSHLQTYDDGSTRYWPSDNTTPGSIGTGTGIADLWRDDEDETTSVNCHWPTVADIRDTDKWLTTETTGGATGYRGANRAGVYTFRMAESYGGAPTNFKRPAIQALYPWLTVPDNNEVDADKEAWPIDDAKRIIVWNEDPGKENKPKQVATKNYRVEYISTVTDTNSQPTLTLRVTKVDDGGQAVHLPDQSEFQIKLPDGTELGIGALTDVSPDLDDWFTGTTGSYQKNGKRLNDTVRHLAFDLVTNTGDPGSGNFGTEREALRRYINLGGWFSVAVKEKGDIVEVDGAGIVTGTTPAPTTTWSDFIPVYVPPRDNYYTESKEYNFIGDNAGLYPWPGGLATTVILPPGTYNPVQINTTNNTIEPVYSSGSTRKVERYGVSTTYNGETGAQPGELHTFTVDPAPEPSPSDDWQKSGPVSIGGHNVTTYGAEYFKNKALYAAYGRVLNLMQAGDPGSYEGGRAKTATVRLEEDQIEPPTGEEKLVLEYVATNGGAPSYNTAGGNVTEIIFEPRTQGYTLRQDYTLVLRNKGTVDIDGINLDTLTDLKGNAVYDKGLDSDPAGGHFEILKPPASFLPAGESTTFVISYVYDLRSKGGNTMEYRDKIFITSNRKDKVPTGDTTVGADYLLDFDAEFQVTNTNIHRVFVNVIPAEKSGVPYPMGTAGVIIGPGTGGTGMNKNAGPTAYVKEKYVYILISPDDEYTKLRVKAVDASGASVTIEPATGYENDKMDADGELVYYFKMPDYDTTVTVTFYEPVSSKLRLSDLRVYASPDKANHYPHTDTTGAGDRTEWDGSKTAIQRRIWQKEFDGVENTNVATKDLSEEARLRLMTGGKAAKPDFEDKVPQYLVVLPHDAEISQVEVDLRAVKYIFDAPGDPIQNVPLEGITVQMTLFNTDDVNRMLMTDSTHNYDIYPDNNYDGKQYAGYYPGKTNGPTTHTSIPFASPEPGKSKYVRVTLSYKDTSGGSGITESRSYYIELHRDTKHVVATLNYGNSPYGMIMNDGAITDKTGAKTTFLNNNYTFNGMAASLTPSVVTAGGLEKIHYWLETWTAPTETWTAPNAGWTSIPPDPVSVFDPETAMSEDLYKKLRKEAPYENDNTNLDLSDYAFFAIMGEEFLDPGIKSATDSSGRPVDLSKAVLSLEVYTLDNTTAGIDKDAPSGQLDRFALPSDPEDLKARTVTIDFLNADDRTKAAVSGDKVTEDWAKWYLTPAGELTRENDAGNTLVELRPGRYRLTYTFPNYNDYTAPSTTTLPEDPAAPKDVADHLTFTRDFVVLAPVGDVNADISVTTGTTTSDEALVEGRISPNAGYPALGYMSYDSDAIFKLRTCDVNNDRNINNIDANTIGKATAVGRFYLPVDYKPAVTPPSP